MFIEFANFASVLVVIVIIVFFRICQFFRTVHVASRRQNISRCPPRFCSVNCTPSVQQDVMTKDGGRDLACGRAHSPLRVKVTVTLCWLLHYFFFLDISCNTPCPKISGTPVSNTPNSVFSSWISTKYRTLHYFDISYNHTHYDIYAPYRMFSV